MHADNFTNWLHNQRRSIHRIAVLTGAGISAESGIPTFRGEDRFWHGQEPAQFFTPEALVTFPNECWVFFDHLRVISAGTVPNAGHQALATLQDTHQVTLATQNIDGLHQRAGSSEVLELHGTLWRVRCDNCDFSVEDNRTPLPELPPLCPGCNGILRPDVVMFTEALPADALHRAWQAAEECDLMLVIGTSGAVYPAGAIPDIAQSHGALVVEVNPNRTALSDEMDAVVRGTAVNALPVVVQALQA